MGLEGGRVLSFGALPPACCCGGWDSVLVGPSAALNDWRLWGRDEYGRRGFRSLRVEWLGPYGLHFQRPPRGARQARQVGESSRHSQFAKAWPDSSSVPPLAARARAGNEGERAAEQYQPKPAQTCSLLAGSHSCSLREGCLWCLFEGVVRGAVHGNVFTLFVV